MYDEPMFLRRVGRKNGSTMIKIIESVRKGDRIKQVCLETVGIAKTLEELESLELIGKKKIIDLLNERTPTLPGIEEIIYGETTTKTESIKINIENIIEEKRLNIGAEDILGQVYSQMDFEDLIQNTRKDEDWNKILKHVVLARILEPSSKRGVSNNSDLNADISLEKIYRMMDHLEPIEQKIKKKIFQSSMGLLNYEVDVLFFDVTTLYFESFEPDDLRNFGFSKDCKFKETQIVLALVTNNRGVPLTYELFPGNQSEGKTLITIVNNIKSTFKLRNVVMVADRAMFNEENLNYMEAEGIKYVVAAKLKTMKKTISNKFLEDYVCPLNGWIKELNIENRRLIVNYSVKRAKKDYGQRKRLIDRLLKKAKEGKIPLKTLITNNGTKKYIEVTGEAATINELKMEQDSAWDGIHGVITNYSSQEKTAEEVLETYKGLWKIEEVFRVNKNDLKMRPIFHWKPSRIRVHILICFMAYVLLNTIKQILVKNELNLSFSELRKEISTRQASIIRDRRTQRRFFVPSKLTNTQKTIYKIFKVPANEKVQPI